MRRLAPVLALIATLLAAAGCTTAVTGTPAASPMDVAAVVAEARSTSADQVVCVDFDAKGGALYNVLVVPMMQGASARTSIDVDVAQLSRATATVSGLGTGSLSDASNEIREEGEQLTTSVQAFEVYEHAEATSLLTAFVGLAVACQQAGHKPSWFDPAELTR